MHLKRLEAFGFKSFADRLEFHFDRGVTGVVGPNGCGKSNVVDAVKWALGDQRPTSIRGTEMADVIFAGSGGRKPLGLAEVSLTFDNADGFLPVGTEEVVVTRRLFRDGTSEYLLNREASRLKDIRELFMDTGGGRGALAILEQGKIDAVLQENPVERRAVFEEAAGISRYRVRQRETLRKIEVLDENLVRIRDVLGMTEKQLRSIRSQAGRAERYRALEQELRAKRIELGLHRYSLLLDERERATARVEDLAAREAEANARLADLSGDLREREGRVASLRDRAASLEAEAGKAEGAVEAALERASSGEKAAGELEGRIAWYEGEIANTGRRLEEAAAQVKAAVGAEAAAEGEVAAREAERKEAEEAIAAAAAEARRAAEGVRDLRARALELLERKGRLANARARLAAEEEGLRARGERLAARRGTAEGERDRRSEESSAAAAASREADAAAAAARAALEEAEGKAASLEARIADLRGRLAALDRAVSAARSRLDVLTSLRDRHEGVGRGARRVLEEAARAGGGLRGVRGILAELLDSEVADAEAVELALGAFAEAVVVESFEDARAAITLLKEEGIGRALFLPLDGVRAPAAGGGGVPGGIPARAAADAVRCADDLRPVVEAVLAGTVLVEDLDGARAAASDGARGLRIVTGGGEVLGVEGAVAGGRGDGAGHGMVARNAEIRTLRNRLSAEERRLAALGRELREAEGAAGEAREAAAAARSGLRGREQAAAEARARADRLAADAGRLEEEVRLLAGEEAEVGEGLRRCAAEEVDLAEQAAAAEAEERDLEEAQSSAHEEEARADERRRRTEDHRAEVRVALARAAERREGAAQRRAAAEKAVRDGERNLELARVELENCRGRREEAIRSASTARAEAELARERRERAIRDLAKAREAAVDAGEALEAARRGVAAMDEEYRSYRGSLEEFRLRENESRMRMEGLLERMREEVRVDLEALHAERRAAAAAVAAAASGLLGRAGGEEAIPVAAPVAPAGVEGEAGREDAAPSPFDPEAAEEEIRGIRSKMERMGNVNMEALDQLDDVERQAVELRTQEQDLAKGREDLLEALRILNRQSRERFTEVFGSIRDHFRETFRRLFGGGKADIFLDEGEDVLEAGVEIVARPPGKELRSISLLSGGERTMTAVALLFAVYRARPSPFCILDEVDAALDEHNIGRFTSMLRDFLDRSQFIIITHSKRTMTICDRLYGISMPEPGVSTRVLLELEKVASSDDEPAPAETIEAA